MEKRLSQVDVAARLGMPQSYVSKIETGERRMDFVETAAFCDAVGIDLASFAKRFARRMERGRKRDDGNQSQEAAEHA